MAGAARRRGRRARRPAYGLPGATTDQIAKQLVLSSETVRSHLKNLYRKLEVNSREEAVRAAGQLRSMSGLNA